MAYSWPSFEIRKCTLGLLALMMAFTVAACGDAPGVSNVTAATTAPAGTATQNKTTTAAPTVAITTTVQKTTGTTTAAVTVAASGVSTKVCGLLTKDEAQDILEEPALEPTQRDSGPSTNCTYKPVNTTTLNFVVITYFNSDYNQTNFDSIQKTVADAIGVTPKAVSRVGDKANSFDRRLDVLKGSKYFVVQVTNSKLNADQAVEKAKTVALKIVQRL